jgi:hypothetical protein
MTRRLVSVLIILLALCAEALSDQITLKNDNRLTGKIVMSDGGKLLVKTDLLGDLTVDLAAVTTIKTDQLLYVTLSDGRTLSGSLSVTADKVELRPANANAILIERSAISLIRSPEEQRAYERSLHPGWLEGWSGGADIGLALTSGNADTFNFALGLAMARKTTRDRTIIYAASVYNRDSTGGSLRTMASRVRGGVRYDRDINRQWFGYVFTDLEHNGSQDLTLRLVPGGGAGYHAIRNDRTQLDLLGGLAWDREYFQGEGNDRSSAEAQVGQSFSQRLNSRTSLKEQLFIFPNLSDGGQYRINFDSTLATDINRRIGWQLTLSDRYLSNPPGFKNDLLLTTGLSSWAAANDQDFDPLKSKAGTSAGRPTRRVEMWVPAIALVRTYQRAWLRNDLVAGLSVAAVSGLGSLFTNSFSTCREKGSAEKVRWLGPRGFALLMISIGICALALATWQHRHDMKKMRVHYPEVQYSLATVLAGLISILGIFALAEVIFRQ